MGFEPPLPVASCVILDNSILIFGLGFSHLLNEEMDLIYFRVLSVPSQSEISLNIKGICFLNSIKVK